MPVGSAFYATRGHRLCEVTGERVEAFAAGIEALTLSGEASPRARADEHQNVVAKRRLEPKRTFYLCGGQAVSLPVIPARLSTARLSNSHVKRGDSSTST